MNQATTAACLNEGQKRAGGSKGGGKEELGQAGIRFTQTVKHCLSVWLSPSLPFHFGEVAAADSDQSSEATQVGRNSLFFNFPPQKNQKEKKYFHSLSCHVRRGAAQWLEIQYVCNAHLKTYVGVWGEGAIISNQDVIDLVLDFSLLPQPFSHQHLALVAAGRPASGAARHYVFTHNEESPCVCSGEQHGGETVRVSLKSSDTQNPTRCSCINQRWPASITAKQEAKCCPARVKSLSVL